MSRVAGVVLAGGEGRRMGGEPKVLRRLGGERLLDRAIARAAPQVDRLLLSCNLAPAQIGPVPCAVVRDAWPAHRGPLAGVLAAMEHLRAEASGADWLCSFAADTPWFPADLRVRLEAACRSAGAGAAVACSAGRRHPVFALWPVSAAPLLRQTIEADADLGVMGVLSRLGVLAVDWDADGFDPFFNVNTPEELALAETRAAARAAIPPATG